MILSELEKKKMQITYSDGEGESFEGPISGQIPLFAPNRTETADSHSLRSELANMDISRITPLEAMNILYSLIEKAKGED